MTGRPALVVLDPDPLVSGHIVQAGAAAGYRAGVSLDAVADGVSDLVVVLAVAAEEHLTLLERVRAAHGTATVVVLVPAHRPGWARLASVHGVRAFVDRRAAPAEVLFAVRMARHGHALVPATWWSQLVGPTAPGPAIDLDDELLHLLQELAQGATVQRMARTRHQGVRTVERRLRQLYLRIGATDRIQAVAKAVQLGLVEVAP
ncbi:hypothetical protein [Actinoplanes sp. NPDC048796]|uniref:hypothetical protein n=1 Tax=unclassified Actinoplanes TaxID=2626549 RepID=UPI0033CF0D6B